MSIRFLACRCASARRRASTDCADTSADARTHTGCEFISTSSPVATHEQRNCRSSGKVLNLQIVLDLLSGEMSPMAKWWTTKTTVRRGVAVGSPSYEIDREVGEAHATMRRTRPD